MDWHRRFLQQASWTRELRRYLMDKAGIDHAERVLEVGCGTGAVLIDLVQRTSQGGADRLSVHGLDIQSNALYSARMHAPRAVLTRGSADLLPFADRRFDITCCHFLLLWLADPSIAIREMRRVTKADGHVLALAEPDYPSRADFSAELAEVGEWQRQALIAQGADPSIGGQLAELFDTVGLRIVETGTIAPHEPGPFEESEWQAEWAVLREDLSGRVPDEDLHRLQDLDRKARQSGERRMHVPTYFVHAQV